LIFYDLNDLNDCNGFNGFNDFKDLNGFNNGQRTTDNGRPLRRLNAMKKSCEKLLERPIQILRGQGGFSILVVMFVMLVLSAIGYSMARMMATKQMSVPVTAQSSSAFYVAEGGINWAGKYLSDLVSWDSLSDQTKNLGDGSFTVVFSEYCSHGNCPEAGTYMCVTATSTGTYGEGKRVLISRYCREQGYGCNP
jgi:hypothetical protein